MSRSRGRSGLDPFSSPLSAVKGPTVDGLEHCQLFAPAIVVSIRWSPVEGRKRRVPLPTSHRRRPVGLGHIRPVGSWASTTASSRLPRPSTITGNCRHITPVCASPIWVCSSSERIPEESERHGPPIPPWGAYGRLGVMSRQAVVRRSRSSTRRRAEPV